MELKEIVFSDYLNGFKKRAFFKIIKNINFFRHTNNISQQFDCWDIFYSGIYKRLIKEPKKI